MDSGPYQCAQQKVVPEAEQKKKVEARGPDEEAGFTRAMQMYLLPVWCVRSALGLMFSKYSTF